MNITEKIAKLCGIEDEKELDKEIDKLTDTQKKIIIKATIKFIQNPLKDFTKEI